MQLCDRVYVTLFTPWCNIFVIAINQLTFGNEKLIAMGKLESGHIGLLFFYSCFLYSSHLYLIDVKFPLLYIT